MKPGTPEYQAYHAQHAKLRNSRGHAYKHTCWGLCGEQARDWANVHGTDRYIPLCRKCHLQYDKAKDVCPKGHDVKKYGRAKNGTCQVCHRITSATRNKRTVCAICGWAKGPNGKCEH